MPSCDYSKGGKGEARKCQYGSYEALVVDDFQVANRSYRNGMKLKPLRVMLPGSHVKAKI